MRYDMAKVVTERPRSGHANRNQKFGGSIHRDKYDADDHGPTWIPWSRHRNHDSKSFTDLLGPLRRYLHKQIGRHWDDVWSDLSATLDKRSLTGIHIFGHIRSEVAQDCFLGVDGKIYEAGRWGWHTTEVRGLFVHPVTRRVCWRQPIRYAGWNKHSLERQLAKFPIPGAPKFRARGDGMLSVDANDARRYRVDGNTVWEQRPAGWFIHQFRDVPEARTVSIDPVTTKERVIITLAHKGWVATKQASKKEMRDARALLCGNMPAGRL